MKPQFTTQIARNITLYGDEGVYKGFGEELFSDDGRHFVRFDLSISVTSSCDRGDYFSPAEYNFTDEIVEITNLHLFDGTRK